MSFLAENTTEAEAAVDKFAGAHKVHGKGGPAHAPAHAPSPTPDKKKLPGGEALGGFGGFIEDIGHGFAQEGLGFLLDPVGGMDRQKAQHELRNKFEILDPSKLKGKHKPNQISEEEFEKLAHTYSDIRLDRSDIKFDPKSMDAKGAAKYKDGAMKDIGALIETPAGRKLIEQLAHNTSGEKDAAGKAVHHTTTLSPFYKSDGKTIDPTNSEEVEKNHTNSANGKGSDTEVHYNPGVNVSPAGSSKSNPWWPARSDVILMHEMTHAYHDTLGDTDYGKVTAADKVPKDIGKNEFEHQAVGLGKYKGNDVSENAYRKQRKEIGKGTIGVLPGDKKMKQRTNYD